MPLINHRYELEELLGRGGMGAVYRAKDRITGEVVALKQVQLAFEQLYLGGFSPTGTASQGLRLALAHEFQILAALRHPHIIEVLDYGFDGERQPFFTMTYLAKARPLTTAGQGQPSPAHFNYLEQLLQALNYLHRQQILHRDLKPENVLVVNDQVKVVDFGLASPRGVVDDSAGSWNYVAPELAEGEQPTVQSDLYAVGVMAYELFAGRHPFDIDSQDFIDQLLLQRPDLDALQVAPAVQAVVGQLLAKTAAERYESAAAALRAFRAAAGLPVPEESVAIRESYLQAAQFVGRETEMAQLGQALQQAQQGQGSAWLVGGESGVGKSRLLDELRTRALVEGLLVLRGQGVASGGLPYQLWREPLRRLLLTGEVSALTAGVLQPLAPDIERLLDRPIEPAPQVEGQAAQQRLYSAIVRLFRQTPQPILLILEDLQWTSESLAILRELNRWVSDWPLLIVGSYRSDERPELPEELPGMRLLPLRRLDKSEITRLSTGILGEIGRTPELIAFLARETEGNAFFLVEVVRALAEEAGRLSAVDGRDLPEKVFPQGIQAVVNRRLGRVSEAGRPLLALAATAGRQLDLPVLHYLAEKIALPMTLVNWLHHCAAVAVLEEVEEQWRFSHDKLRAGVLAGVAPARQRDHHTEVAQGIAHVYPDDPTRAAMLVYHWHEAGDEKQEWRYIQLAAREATRQYAHNAAEDFYTRALSLAERAPVSEEERQKRTAWALHGLGEVSEQQGNHPAAADYYERALTIFEELGDRERQVQSLRALGTAAIAQGFYEAGRTYYHQALSLTQQMGNRLEEARVFKDLGRVETMHRRTNDHGLANHYLQQSLTLLQETKEDLSIKADVLRMLGMMNWGQSRYDAAEPYLKESLIIHQELKDRQNESLVLNNLGMLAWAQGQFELALDYYGQSHINFQEIGDRYNEGRVLNNIGLAFFALCRYDKIKLYFEQSISVAKEINARPLLCAALCNLGDGFWKLGQYEEAQSYYEQSLFIAQELNNQDTVSSRLSNLGLVAWGQGNYELAKQYCEQGLDVSRQIDNPLTRATILLRLGTILIDSGQFVLARNHLEEALALFGEINNQHLFMEATTTLAYYYWKQSQVSSALITLNTVLDYLDKGGNFDGAEYGLRNYLICYQILQTDNDPRAYEVLNTAYEQLVRQREQLVDGMSRRAFIENVPWHHEIILSWENLAANTEQ